MSIKLVANLLFPMRQCTTAIEHHAKSMLTKVLDIVEPPKPTPQEPQSSSSSSSMAVEQTTPGEGKQVEDEQQMTVESADTSSSPSPSSSSSSSTITQKPTPTIPQEVERCSRLFFAICLKKAQGLSEVMNVCTEIKVPIVMRTFVQQSQIVISTVQQSYKPEDEQAPRYQPDILELIRGARPGGEMLAVSSLYMLKQHFDKNFEPVPKEIVKVALQVREQLNHPRILIPVLSLLTKAQVVEQLPGLVTLSAKAWLEIIAAVRKSSNKMSLIDLLEELHLLDVQVEFSSKTDQASIQYTTAVTKCIMTCMSNNRFTKEIIVSALTRLANRRRLPPLLVHTCLDAIKLDASMKEQVPKILNTLTNKEELWQGAQFKGFIACCAKAVPHSYDTILRLSEKQWKKVRNVKELSKLRKGLKKHVKREQLYLERYFDL
eukprot:TRINITY_DN3764_c1_g2_i1.p1 TRINITY_DN3764_c1_g2~~TRINITY_DN3764_c1_g2_i1.p1  ORF type:complete len:433 (+),score=139.94 TRINITY_DN3764_c1_g2_i1:363-1661(+)